MGASGGVSGVWGWYAHPDWGRGRCCDGPRCAVLPQQGYTPVSRHNTHVTAKHICHKTSHVPQQTHMSQRNTHATAQYICHSTTNMSQSKQSMHYNTQTTKYAARGLAQHVCGTSLQHAQVPSHSIAAQYRYAYGKLCMSRGHESCPAHDN